MATRSDREATLGSPEKAKHILPRALGEEVAAWNSKWNSSPIPLFFWLQFMVV